MEYNILWWYIMIDDGITIEIGLMTMKSLYYKEKIWNIIFINDDEYLYTNTIEFYYNSNSISYFNSS